MFLDFLEKCLDWSPITRITPLEALQHEWILSGLPEKVLMHHLEMFKGKDDRETLRDATYSEIQGFPENAGSQQITDIVKQLKKAYSTSTVNMMSQDYQSSPKSALQALSHIATVQHQKVSQTIDHKLLPSQIVVNETVTKP
jgi:serine/threonine protein kinase